MILLVDNYDSFTYNLKDYFERLGGACRVIRNDFPMEKLYPEPYPTGVVLSPGPGRPENAGNLMKMVGYFHDKCPILGICLGHQALGMYFGAELDKAEKPYHGKVSRSIHKKDYLFHNLPDSFNTVRYHSLILKNLPGSLQALGHTESGEISALKHNSLPLRGIQYHPESYLTEYGIEILKNWLVYNKITS